METVTWLIITTVFSYLVAETVKYWTTRHPPQLILGWARDAWTSFKRKGYLLVATLAAAYVGLYSIMEARHERSINRASLEYTTFISMVSSDSRNAFITAMKGFGPVQIMAIPREPDLFKPWEWWGKDTPNKEPLRLWARQFLVQCTIEQCGNPSSQPIPYRIDLREANLQAADLRGAKLSQTDLTLANLKGADLSTVIRIGPIPKRFDPFIEIPGLSLRFKIEITPTGPELTTITYSDRTTLHGANLFWADLRDADLTGVDLAESYLAVADLRGAKLNEAFLLNARFDAADLRGVDLTRTIELSQEQLDSACINEATKIPDKFKRPRLCPW